MVKNEGTVDRGIRAVLGVVLILVALFAVAGNTVLQVILGIVGAIMLVTAAIGFCPLYRIFGINTCKK